MGREPNEKLGGVVALGPLGGGITLGPLGGAGGIRLGPLGGIGPTGAGGIGALGGTGGGAGARAGGTRAGATGAGGRGGIPAGGIAPISAGLLSNLASISLWTSISRLISISDISRPCFWKIILLAFNRWSSSCLGSHQASSAS